MIRIKKEPSLAVYPRKRCILQQLPYFLDLFSWAINAKELDSRVQPNDGCSRPDSALENIKCFEISNR